ncbi:hypothetical protein AB0B50_25790 [Streptomyces sp. NPDC041068]|uniref:hypothetical protein n=1 Tax=Streptomyces sp. NPDC041068 TaxID=3155130 RepID=UPI0033EB6A39
MADPVQEQLFDVFVDNYAFAFVESWDAELPVEFPDGFDADVFVNAFPGRVDVSSAGDTHTVAMTVQVWDGAPPGEDDSAWDAHGEARFESESGDVAIWTPSLGRTDDLVELGGKGSWRVRVYCAGRAVVAAQRESEEPVAGVERYLVQFFRAD